MLLIFVYLLSGLSVTVLGIQTENPTAGNFGGITTMRSEWEEKKKRKILYISSHHEA